MTDQSPIFALPLVESHVQPIDGADNVLLALETIAGKFAVSLAPLEAASLAHDLLEWSATKPDPEDIVVDSRPMTVEGLTFGPSSRPGFVRMELVLGASRLLFELQGDQLASAAAAMLPKGPR